MPDKNKLGFATRLKDSDRTHIRKQQNTTNQPDGKVTMSSTDFLCLA